jgi:hypothetical protein
MFLATSKLARFCILLPSHFPEQAHNRRLLSSLEYFCHKLGTVVAF